jgi:hypothetical protein
LTNKKICNRKIRAPASFIKTKIDGHYENVVALALDAGILEESLIENISSSHPSNVAASL